MAEEVEINQEQALFLVNQLMPMIPVDAYNDLDTNKHGISANESGGVTEFTVKNKGTMSNINFFRVYNCKTYIEFYINSPNPQASKYGPPSRDNEVKFRYRYTFKSFSKVNRTMLKYMKPFLNKKDKLYDDLEKAKKAVITDKFNDTVAVIFPHVVDNILLGDKNDK